VTTPNVAISQPLIECLPGNPSPAVNQTTVLNVVCRLRMLVVCHQSSACLLWVWLNWRQW